MSLIGHLATNPSTAPSPRYLTFTNGSIHPLVTGREYGRSPTSPVGRSSVRTHYPHPCAVHGFTEDPGRGGREAGGQPPKPGPPSGLPRTKPGDLNLTVGASPQDLLKPGGWQAG